MIKLCKNKSIPVPLECINLDPNQLKKVISFLMDNSDIIMNDDIIETLSVDNRSYFMKTFKEGNMSILRNDLYSPEKTHKTTDSVLDDYAII
jgi:hypothetical protein